MAEVEVLRIRSRFQPNEGRGKGGQQERGDGTGFFDAHRQPINPDHEEVEQVVFAFELVP